MTFASEKPPRFADARYRGNQDTYFRLHGTNEPEISR
jgi:hypothetical protein